MKNIFVYGSMNVDFVYELDHWPVSGETLAARDFSTYFGGKGANQAVSAARLGGQVYMIGNVGHDLYGPKIIDDLRREHVDVSGISLCSENTGSAVIMLAQSENRIILHAGANKVTAHDAFSSILNARARPGDIALFQFEKTDTDIKENMEFAKKRSMFVMCNPAPMNVRLVHQIEAYVDLWIMNESEAAHIQKNAFDPMTFFAEFQHQNVILTLGSLGSMTNINHQIVSIPAHATPHVLDTTGAGDTYVGAIAYHLSKNDDLLAAMKRASVAASLSIRKMGARTGMPTRDELERTIIDEKNEA
jgi:ribokinase